jgi:hypothetical protein
MTHDAWKKLPDDEKLDYLFRWNEKMEETLNRLLASAQFLHERLKKVEAAVAESAA